METAIEIAGFLATLFVMLLGIAGTVLPIIPGTSLIFIAAVAHRLCFGADGAPVWLIVFLGGLTVFSIAVDFGASILGAKRFGATRWGLWGASLGGLCGLFLGRLALVFGPFLGATASEAIGGRDWKNAARAGAGATLGLAVGTIAKLLCALSMTAAWMAAIIQHWVTN
jgi:uncharacterized protein YqgC (DUF456 family)